MEWYVIVWYGGDGLVRYDMVWYGMVWCGWYGLGGIVW